MGLLLVSHRGVVMNNEPLALLSLQDQREQSLGLVPLFPFETPMPERHRCIGPEQFNFQFAENGSPHRRAVWVTRLVSVVDGLPTALEISPRSESGLFRPRVGLHEAVQIAGIPFPHLLVEDTPDFGLGIGARGGTVNAPTDQGRRNGQQHRGQCGSPPFN